MKAKSQKRKRTSQRIFVWILLVLSVWWFQNFTLTTGEAVIKSEKIRDEITIVQITDLHGARFGIGNRRLIRLVERQRPDLVFATGDLFTNDSADGKKTALELLSALAETCPVYYVNGEHDYNYSGTDDFFDKLTQAGVNVLHYKDEIITVKQTKLHLYGINNVYYTDTFDLANAFEKDTEHFSVLLAHIANFDKFASFGMDLSVCGDTHGGMFRLPVVGALYSGDTFLPDRNGQYMKGLYEKNGAYLFVSSGLGHYPAPVRFCNRPEIGVIRLVPDGESFVRGS